MQKEDMPHPYWRFSESLGRFYSWKWLIAIIIAVLAIWIAEPWEENLSQVLANSIFTGSTYVLLAIGLTLVYRILKFANFSHAEFVTFGMYMAFLAFSVSSTLGLDIGGDILWGILIAFVLTGLLGIVSDKAVFGQLREREANAMTIMISSIGVGLIIRHLIQEVWTSKAVWYETRLPEWIPQIIFPRRSGTYDYIILDMKVRKTAEFSYAYDFHLHFLTPIADLTTLAIDKITLTPIQIFVILCSTLFVLAAHFLFTRTKLGKAMRATSDNPDLAQAAGIDTRRVILLVWFIGAGLAGAGGVLSIAHTRRITPYTGFGLLLIAFAVVILGGIGSFYGAVIAAYIMGFAENFGVMLLEGLGRRYTWLSRTLRDLGFPLKLTEVLPLTFDYGYKPAISFVILVVVLIIRPRGIMGLPEEAGKDE
ncbi:MAG: branched-chain amino acid ABC transporter permease [Candidatus Hodarchaeales archaeon]|jgi:branched-subunit amino acid ABC-type transport system permease component